MVQGALVWQAKLSSEAMQTVSYILSIYDALLFLPSYYLIDGGARPELTLLFFVGMQVRLVQEDVITVESAPVNYASVFLKGLSSGTLGNMPPQRQVWHHVRLVEWTNLFSGIHELLHLLRRSIKLFTKASF